MKFAILIDYANLFISIKKSLQLKTNEELENEIGRIITATKEKLAKRNQYSKKGIEVVHTKAFVLDEPNFGNPEASLGEIGFEIIRVQDQLTKKSKEMKDMNQSRSDDDALMNEALQLVQSGQVDGILVVSNDGDFESIGKKIQYIGRYFWAGIYESQNLRASIRLKKEADVVIPLHEMVSDVSEGIPLPITEEVEKEAVEEISGAHIQIFQRGQVILTYPVNRKVIEIGRRSTSRFHYPNIDLTDYDHERVVSRQHAKIQKVGDHLLFSVHKECSRGTWKEGKIIYPGEQFFLLPDMRIVLGSDKGFGLLYKEA